MKIKKILISISAILCAGILFVFPGCSLFHSDTIDAVRNRVETLRKEVSERMIEALKNEDILAVKDLFCQKSQELKSIYAQIESTFHFMDGQIESYKISDSTGYERYSNEYGTVVQYTFGSDIYITTDTGRYYDLYFKTHYIELDSSIKGMTSYILSENDKDSEDGNSCKAGYDWSSPYDGECGLISAKLISAVSQKDADAVKSLLCQKTLEAPELDSEIQAVFEFFQGMPLFTEREDGLYDGLSENDLACRVLAYETEKDKDGAVEAVWVSVTVLNVLTDADKHYSIDFAAYLQCNHNPQNIGVSFFSLEDFNAGEQKQVGEWIHE